MKRPLLLLGVLALAAISAFAGPSNTSGPALDARSKACLECHRISPDHSHPVGVPARPILGLPLTPSGALACRTCHQEPGSLQRHADTGEGVDLRRPAALLCRACHAGPTRPGSVLAHALRLNRAHLIPGSSDDTNTGPELDRESQHCLACHDGGMASSASVTVGGGSGFRSLAGQAKWPSEHPVGVPYDPRPGNGDFNPGGSLPPGMRLFGGQVGCGSCHSVYSGIGQMLSRPNQGSALCLACHQK